MQLWQNYRRHCLFHVTSSSYKLQVTSYELQVASYELRVTSYELRVTSYELQGMTYRLKDHSLIHGTCNEEKHMHETSCNNSYSVDSQFSIPNFNCSTLLCYSEGFRSGNVGWWHHR